MYFDPKDRRTDGAYEFVWYGVCVQVVSGRASGRFTRPELRFADVRLAGAGSRGTGFLERLRPLDGRGTCFLAQFHVRPGESVSGRKQPGDRARVTVRFPRRPDLVRTTVVRRGNIDKYDRSRHGLIRRAGCRPPRPIVPDG